MVILNSQKGDVPPTGALGFHVWTVAPIRMMPRAHSHADLEANYLAGGSITYMFHGQIVRIPAGSLCLFWASLPHQVIACDPGARLGIVVLPLTTLWQWGCPPALSQLLLTGSVVAERAAGSGDLELISRWKQMLARRDVAWELIVRLEVEARFRRFMLSDVDVLSSATAAAAPVRRQSTRAAGVTRSHGEPLLSIQKMAQFVADHCREAISVADVANEAELHPSHAMRRFKQVMGMTLVDYLTRCRVAVAQRLLITTAQPILQIAQEAGFGSVSRFYEAFATVTDTTPAKYRRLHRKS